MAYRADEWRDEWRADWDVDWIEDDRWLDDRRTDMMADALGWFSLGLGAVELLAPETLDEWWASAIRRPSRASTVCA